MTIGLIGCGKMGSALTLGAIRAGVVTESQIRAYDPVAAAVESLQKEADITAAGSLEELITSCDTFLLCVKPNDVAPILADIAKLSTGESTPLVLSIAAGVTLSTMESASEGRVRIVRIMPNTPAMIGKGAAAYSLGASATPEDGAFTGKLLSSTPLPEPPEAARPTSTRSSRPSPTEPSSKAFQKNKLCNSPPRPFSAVPPWLPKQAFIPPSFAIASRLRVELPSPGSGPSKRAHFVPRS